LSAAVKVWEIWFAYVRYRDGSGGKERPVVIRRIVDDSCEVLPIYGSPSQNADYEILEWSDAGLVKPSCVNLFPRVVGLTSLRRRIGHLATHDIKKILQLINTYI
jgi:hypothetical protein